MFKLCFVRGSTAYFTTQELDTQTGDDWNDTPYEHNAGTPYEPLRTLASEWTADGHPKWEIYRVMFDAGSLQTPGDLYFNSPYSVKHINAGMVAWLAGTDASTGQPVVIHAGATIAEFKRKVKMAGGAIYIREN
jgi:hypothetical protein